MTWTRSHERLFTAQVRLCRAQRRYFDLGAWLARKELPPLTELTVAQARLCRRELNAWRAGVEGLTAEWRRYPRKERRARARMMRRREEARA